MAFRGARAAIAYEGPARRLLAAWKERGLTRLDRLLGELVSAEVERPEADAITYVPGDPDRTLWRGINAAEALARQLADRWELSTVPVLVRTRRVGRQRGLDRSTRRTNVRGAFRATAPVPRRVVLVDDVYTTGARSVDVVTLARAVRG